MGPIGWNDIPTLPRKLISISPLIVFSYFILHLFIPDKIFSFLPLYSFFLDIISFLYYSHHMTNKQLDLFQWAQNRPKPCSISDISVPDLQFTNYARDHYTNVFNTCFPIAQFAATLGSTRILVKSNTHNIFSNYLMILPNYAKTNQVADEFYRLKNRGFDYLEINYFSNYVHVGFNDDLQIRIIPHTIRVMERLYGCHYTGIQHPYIRRDNQNLVEQVLKPCLI